MRFSSILILTYGRTGSTLLTGVLNAIPGVLVRGENQNMFAGLYLGYKRLLSTQTMYGAYSQQPTSPFFGINNMCGERYLAWARKLAYDQLVSGAADPVHVYGFKEVRYTRAVLEADGIGELAPYLDFLAELFPNPAFIVLTRAHGDVAASSFWRSVSEDEAYRQMQFFDEDMRSWGSGREDVLWLDYDDALAGPKPYRAVFDFLGVPYEVDRVSSVLGIQHSDDNRRESVVRLPV